MADSGSFLRDQFVCGICLELLSRPATLPCGHNFCCGCVSRAWDVSGQTCCPLCKEHFSSRPELRVNTALAQASEELRRRSKRSEGVVSLSEGRAARSGEDTQRVVCESQRLLQEHVCTKHQRGLELYCRIDQSLLCSLCAQIDHRQHAVVPAQTEFDQQRAALERRVSELSLRTEAMQRRTQRLEENLSTLRDEARAETHAGERLFTAFTRTAKSALTALQEDIEDRQRAAERRVHTALEQVRAEKAALSRTKANLEDLAQTEDPLDFLKRFRDLDDREEEPDEVTVQGSLEGAVRSAVERLHAELSVELQKLSAAELRSVQMFEVDICLDPNTAHAALRLSDDHKGVHCGDAKQKVPYSASRFTDTPCVLSTPLHPRSAKLYFEVQVTGKTRWYLGVAKGSLSRRGQVAANPSAGLWVLWLKGGQEYRALDEPAVPLPLGRSLERVGVLVDRGEGVVRFYDADSAEHIYTFSGCGFTEELRAFFGPCSNDGGRNMAPLVITAVRKTRSVTT